MRLYWFVDAIGVRVPCVISRHFAENVRGTAITGPSCASLRRLSAGYSFVCVFSSFNAVLDHSLVDLASTAHIGAMPIRYPTDHPPLFPVKATSPKDAIYHLYNLPPHQNTPSPPSKPPQLPTKSLPPPSSPPLNAPPLPRPPLPHPASNPHIRHNDRHTPTNHRRCRTSPPVHL